MRAGIIGVPRLRLATIPEILWEASLGLYLTFKGFRPSPILAGDIEAAGVGAE